VEESSSSSPEIKLAFDLCMLIYTDAYESVADVLPLSRPLPVDDTPGTELMNLKEQSVIASVISEENTIGVE